ncbi:MAG: serine hydrolase [Planctomycetes bacterium]|nr:serine hydrolase [Planctomycetota bacterium]
MLSPFFVCLTAAILTCPGVAASGFETPPNQAAARAALDAAALVALVEQGRSSHSDALVVFHRGRLAGEWYFDKPRRKIEAMSVTKSIVNLIVGRLISTGVIKSLDTPVGSYFPEWNQGLKKDITLRHLLDQTSGLQNVPRADLEIYPSPDVVKLALAAELSHPPGAKWSYNNKAVNLIAGVIERAAGKKMDVLFREDLCKAMGITDTSWDQDAAGNPYCMAGLKIHAKDLAKFGVLVVNRGAWNGKRLIAEQWFADSLKPATPLRRNYGLLWWLIYDRTTYIVDDAKIDELRAAGVAADFIERATALKGKYVTDDEYIAALQRAFGADYMTPLREALAPHSIALSSKEYEDLVGFRAEGRLGQYIVIYPDVELVAVRMIEWSKAYNPATDRFEDFPRLVRNLVRSH